MCFESLIEVLGGHNVYVICLSFLHLHHDASHVFQRHILHFSVLIYVKEATVLIDDRIYKNSILRWSI